METENMIKEKERLRQEVIPCSGLSYIYVIDGDNKRDY